MRGLSCKQLRVVPIRPFADIGRPGRPWRLVQARTTSAPDPDQKELRAKSNSYKRALGQKSPGRGDWGLKDKNFKTADRRLRPARPLAASRHATIRIVANRPDLDNIKARPGPKKLQTITYNYKHGLGQKSPGWGGLSYKQLQITTKQPAGRAARGGSPRGDSHRGESRCGYSPLRLADLGRRNDLR